MTSIELEEIISAVFIILILLLLLAGIKVLTFVNQDFNPKEEKKNV